MPSGRAADWLAPVPPADEPRQYRITIWAMVAGITLFAASVVAWGLSVGNRQLTKDGIDWVYDIVLYVIAAIIYGRGDAAERVSAFAIAVVIATAGFHTLYDLYDKIVDPRPIEVAALGFTAGTVIVIAYLCAGAMYRFRDTQNALIMATWLSSRNDAIKVTGFALVVFAVRVAPVRWPEYALDVFGAALNFQAAWLISRQALRAKPSVPPPAPQEASRA